MNSFVLFALRTREGVRLSCDTHRDAHLVFCVGGSGVDRIKGSPGELAPCPKGDSIHSPARHSSSTSGAARGVGPEPSALTTPRWDDNGNFETAGHLGLVSVAPIMMT